MVRFLSLDSTHPDTSLSPMLLLLRSIEDEEMEFIVLLPVMEPWVHLLVLYDIHKLHVSMYPSVHWSNVHPMGVE